MVRRSTFCPQAGPGFFGRRAMTPSKDIVKEAAKSDDEIDSQFKDENEEDGPEKSLKFMMACEDFALQVDDDLQSEEEEHTFSRDN